jgi:hypothetical protein
MGFFDLVNIRAINGKLNDLMPVVEANLSRFTTYFDNNFKVTKRQKYGQNSLYRLGEYEEVILTTQKDIDELLRLKKEFESEFVSALKIVEKIKPVTFLDDDSSYVHWNNELASINFSYNVVIELMNNHKIYIQS